MDSFSKQRYNIVNACEFKPNELMLKVFFLNFITQKGTFII